MDLIFATHNSHKAEEINKLLPAPWNARPLSAIGYKEDVPETGETLEDNALQKARHIWQELGVDCFADDTGLEIDALGGAPGVYSARYAGPGKDSAKNMQKVLKEMEGITDRRARFRTVIALILNGETTLFEGRVEGEILRELRGHHGFGYDPVFRPDGAAYSFAQMPLDEKNRISHRSQAIGKLVRFLEAVKNH